MNLKPFKNRSASVMVMALWALVTLTLLAASMGLGMRQKITLLSRLEERTRIRLLAESGIKKAIILLNRDLELNKFVFSSSAKMFRHNNGRDFKNIQLKDGQVGVGYETADGPGLPKIERWGMVDEESKLPLNLAQAPELARLIKTLFEWDDARAQEAARAIIDWREYGASEIKGFYSEEYYGSEDHAYPTKNEDYELIDELMLVNGLDPDSARKLISYLTLYGPGRVNINTASRPVLLALGLEEELIYKIFFVRRGKDQVEATADDYIFLRTYDIVSEMTAFVKLSDTEARQIDVLNQANRLDVNSLIYSIHAEAALKEQSRYSIWAVYDGQETRVLYWREEY